MSQPSRAMARLLALLPALLAALAPALCPAAPPPQPAFRGAVFGDQVAAMPDMAVQARFGDVAFAARPEEKPLTPGCADTVRYAFYRGRLYAVRLTLSGCESVKDVIRAYTAKYGQPESEGAAGVTRLLWRQPKLTIGLSHFARDGATVVEYTYLPGLTGDERETYQDPEAIRRDGPVGFRGVRFGRELAGLPDMVPAYGEAASAYYRRTRDRLTLGEIKLADVLYGFYQGRFFAALMRVGSCDDFEPLRKAYTAKYGPPRALTDPLEESLVWEWPTARIALTRNRADATVEVRYADTRRLAEVIAAEAKLGAPAALGGGHRQLAAGSPPTAFRGAIFGASLTTLKNPEYLYVHRDLRYYRRTDDQLALGDIPLGSIIYAFDNDRLASVTLTLAPPKEGGDAGADFERVKAAFAAKYGRPVKRDDPDGELYLLNWPNLSIALLKPSQGPVEIHYVATSLLRERERGLADKALDALDAKIFSSRTDILRRIERPSREE